MPKKINRKRNLLMKRNYFKETNSFENSNNIRVRSNYHSHSKSAFKPVSNLKTTDIEINSIEKLLSSHSKTLPKNQNNLNHKLEAILSTNHQKPIESPGNIDYRLYYSIMSSIWNQSKSSETQKLFNKYKINRSLSSSFQLRSA